jgi:branched-chain amino acid transport system permease protein
MDAINEIVIFGLLRGAIFALAAFGFSLVLGVLGIVNFAHGVFVVLGALITWSLQQQLGTNIVIASLVAAAAMGVLGVSIQKVFISRVFKLHPLMILVQTFGVAVVATQLAELVWGGTERLVRVDLPGPAIVGIGDMLIPTWDIVVFAICLAAAGGLVLILQATSLGRAVRACRDSVDSASLVGVDVDKVFLITMGICGVWSGLAGALVVTQKPTGPYMHFYWTLDAFLVCIIGGLGSIGGALLGGFLYGVVNFAAYYYLPNQAPAIIFATLIVLLMVRPQGLFGLGQTVRK